MFQSLLGSLLNHLYHYANENVSKMHLSLICGTSILTTIYSLKNCSVYGRSNRIYSPKSFGFFQKEFRQVKKIINMLFIVTSVLKMLDKGHSFLPYRPLSRQITYISSFRKIWKRKPISFLAKIIEKYITKIYSTAGVNVTHL